RSFRIVSECQQSQQRHHSYHSSFFELAECPRGVLANQGAAIAERFGQRWYRLRIARVAKCDAYVSKQLLAIDSTKRGARGESLELGATHAEHCDEIEPVVVVGRRQLGIGHRAIRRRSVPRTNLLANVAAEYHGAHARAKLARNGTPVLNCQIRNATAGV